MEDRVKNSIRVTVYAVWRDKETGRSRGIDVD